MTSVYSFICSLALLTGPNFAEAARVSAKHPLYAAAKRRPAQVDSEMTGGPTAEQIKSLLRKIATEKSNCERTHCSKEKILIEFEKSLKFYKALREHTNLLIEENSSLRNQARVMEGTGHLPPTQNCYKKQLLSELMLDNGISLNGGYIYSKQPLSVEGSQCWTNSRKKKASTVTLCEFPLAINIQTEGGASKNNTVRKREYIFELNKCDLMSVRIHDESVSGVIDSNISYPSCLEQWNKRTADAAMNPTQVRLMEDTIGFCFREHLLPPRRSKSGRVNPAASFEPESAK